MIEIIVTPTGDNAEADDPAAAVVAARQLLRDARENGAGDPRASFIVDGECVRANLKPSEV